MNTAPGHIPEELIEETPLNRRQMMKLISFDSPRRRSRLRIDVDDDLLQPSLGKAHASGRKKTVVKGRSDTSETNNTGSVRGGMIAIAGAAVTGLAIGYLVGRLRNR